MFMNRDAQGALEYLLLIGGAVIVAAVVIVLVSDIATTGQAAAEDKAFDPICAPLLQDACSIRDPDGTGSMTKADCFWVESKKQCKASSIEDALVLYIPFDQENSTQFLDFSMSANPGVKNGGVASVADGVNNSRAVLLDGVDDYIDFGDKATQKPVKQVSVSVWVNFSQFGTNFLQYSMISKYSSVAGSNNGYIVFESLDAVDQKPRFKASVVTSSEPAGKNITGGTVLSPNSWYNIVAVYDGAVLSLYLNGKEESTVPLTGDIVWTGAVSNLLSGTGPAASGQKLSGKMDNLRIWSRALSPREIVNIYSQGK